MFGIVSRGREKIPGQPDLPYGDASVESFGNGFLSISSEESTNSFLQKGDLNRKILVFEGRLFVDNYVLEPVSDKEKISETIFSLYSKKGVEHFPYLFAQG